MRLNLYCNEEKIQFPNKLNKTTFLLHFSFVDCVDMLKLEFKIKPFFRVVLYKCYLPCSEVIYEHFKEILKEKKCIDRR